MAASPATRCATPRASRAASYTTEWGTTNSEGGVPAEAEPDDVELMYILANAVIFRQAPPFTQQRIASVADLVTYGEYLMDVARLLRKSTRIPVPALIVAALMANESLNHAHEEDPRNSFKDAWREIMLAASELFITSSSPAERG